MPLPAWDACGVRCRQGRGRELAAALDDVTGQLLAMSRDEIIDQEDLAWSLPNGVYIESEILSVEPLLVRLQASKGIWLGRAVDARTVRLSTR